MSFYPSLTDFIKIVAISKHLTVCSYQSINLCTWKSKYFGRESNDKTP